jgi:hypothetical protein
MRRGVEEVCKQGEEEGVSATAAVQAVYEELRRVEMKAGHWSAAAAEVWEGDMRVALGLALEWHGRRFMKETVMAMSKEGEVTMSSWEQGEETGGPWQEVRGKEHRSKEERRLAREERQWREGMRDMIPSIRNMIGDTIERVKELRMTVQERMEWLGEDGSDVEDGEEEEWDYELHEAEEELEELMRTARMVRRRLRTRRGVDDMMGMIEWEQEHGTPLREEQLKEEVEFLQGKRRGMVAGGDGGKRLVGY